MKSARKILILPNRRRDELEFLPAALEIVETPPSPVGRAVAITIVIAFAFATAWACVGTVDVVASAPGKIVPSGGSKLIQPFEMGVVRSIRVHDGSRVMAGDVLVELDPTMNAAELGRLQGDLVAAQIEAARLRAMLSESSDPLTEFQPPAKASPAQAELHRQYLLSQAAEFRTKLAVLDRQREQKEAERSTIGSTIGKLEATLPVVFERFEVRKMLFGKELGAKLQYLEALQQLLEQQQELVVQRSRYGESTAAIAAIQETKAQAVAEHRRTRFAELVEADRKTAGLLQDVIKAEKRTEFQMLTAPVDGVVQQLAVHTVGGVVTPAQTLLIVVPTGDKLEIEATVPNRDIGFVRPGQDAEIKVDTFNFTRYGLVRGKVLVVSSDAVPRDKPLNGPVDRTQSADNGTSEQRGQELGYPARISLDRQKMEVDGKVVDLSPGMAVTVEIRTGSRTVMSYLLAPLSKYRQASLRER